MVHTQMPALFRRNHNRDTCIYRYIVVLPLTFIDFTIHLIVPRHESQYKYHPSVCFESFSPEWHFNRDSEHASNNWRDVLTDRRNFPSRCQPPIANGRSTTADHVCYWRDWTRSERATWWWFWLHYVFYHIHVLLGKPVLGFFPRPSCSLRKRSLGLIVKYRRNSWFYVSSIT